LATFTCPEAELHCTFITEAVDRIVATHDGLSVDELNWQPPAPETNSVYVLAVHTIANVREAILQILGDQQIGRVRDDEFIARADATSRPVQDWPAQKQEIVAAMQRITCDRMTETVDHPRRGPESVREVLLSTSTHAREHTGHAELTRQLILAARESA
jgi:hypothetical protein